MMQKRNFKFIFLVFGFVDLLTLIKKAANVKVKSTGIVVFTGVGRKSQGVFRNRILMNINKP
jgi:hypothetical protein